MQDSTEVRDALLKFYNRLSASDVAAFDDVISSLPITSVMGTAPGEWVTQRDRLRFGFETEGVTLTPGTRPVAYREGTVGFAIDEPLFGFPNGAAIRVRVTTIWRQEAGSWKLVHGHFSSGVPDEEVAELQKAWGVN